MIPFLCICSKSCLMYPLGRPTVTAGRDNCFCTCRPSVPTFHNLAKQNEAKTMFAAGETVGLAEWLIDDTCLICIISVTNELQLLEEDEHFKETMTYRINLIESGCQKFKIGSIPVPNKASLLEAILFVPEFDILWCPVFKASSSTWLFYLLDKTTSLSQEKKSLEFLKNILQT